MECELSNGTVARVFYNGYYDEWQVDIMLHDSPIACIGWYQTEWDAINALMGYADARGLEATTL